MTPFRTTRVGSRHVFVATQIGLALAMSVSSIARAETDSVEKSSARVFELEARLADLDRQLRSPEDAQGQLAERRLVDAEVAYTLKNYEASSIILYDIIEKYPTSRVYPEALYFLSDSLYLKRDYFSSRRYFEKLVELGPSSGKFQEALQRLVELSLHTGDYAPVDGYLSKLAQLPVSELLPSVPYVAGKYHYFRRQFDVAITTLRALPPTHRYYLNGLYFIGASYVAQGPEHLADALSAFDTIIKVETDTDAAAEKKAAGKPDSKDGKNDASRTSLSDPDKLVVELAHLGRARILAEQGQATSALAEYAHVASTSPNFNDALYESAWVNIKNKEYQRATRQLDLLLLNSPDSILAPEVRLLTGQLFVLQKQFGLATSSFTHARDEYEPLSKTLQAELGKTPDPAGYFRDAITKHLADFDTSKILPGTANKWVKDDAGVQRLRDLLVDEADLEKSLVETNETIARLERALSGPGRVNVFPELARARTRGVEIARALTEVRTVLSEHENRLITPVAGAQADQLKALHDEQLKLEAQLKQMPTKEESIAERQQKARNAFNEIDKQASEVLVDVLGVRAQVVATNKFYHDTVEKTLKVEQQVAAQRELDAYMSEIEGEQAAVDKVRRELEDAGQSVGVDDSDMRAAEALKAQYDGVLSRQHALVQQLSSRLSPADRSKSEQIESVLLRARGIDEKLVAYNHKIDGLLEEKLAPIRSTVAEEKTRVVGYHATLGGYSTESTEIGGGVVADGLRAASQRFYNIVVRSDVGIIDVAWALKDTATKDGARLASERKRELKLLDDEFKEVLKEHP